MGSNKSRLRGFTLMELMIVIALAAVILTIGAPNFSEFRRNNALTRVANDFLASSQFARSEAIKRQQTIAICPSAAPGAAEPACSSDGFTGWIVFEDVNGDCVRTPGAERVVRAEGPYDRSGLARAPIRSSANGRCISYGANGFARPLPAGLGATQVLFCDDRGLALQGGTGQSAARGLAFGRTGRAEVTRDRDTLDGWGLACP